MTTELYGTKGCPYTAELREELEWKSVEFVEYDVERDPEAMRRLAMLVPMPAAVPVLVRDGRVAGVGHNGRSCFVTPE